MVIFNYDNNTIGFANKQRHFGAEILGQNAPGPRRPYFIPIDEAEEDKDFIDVDETGNPTDNWTPPQPWQPTPADTGSQRTIPKTTLTIVIWSIVLLFIGFLCYLRYQKSKSKQRMAQKTSDLEYDDNKDPPLLYRQQKDKETNYLPKPVKKVSAE